MHALAGVEWERWEHGGEVDPAEAEYDMDVWVPEEEVDREAAAAAAEGSRWRGESSGGVESVANRGRALLTGSPTSSGDESARGADTGGARTTVSRARPRAVMRAPSDRFGWVVKAAPKGKGWQKRKKLLMALIGLWEATPSVDEEELPATMKRAVYKAMAGTMAPKQVAMELGTLVKAGVVTVRGDEVRCSEGRGGAGAAAAGPTASTQTTGAESRKRQRAETGYAESGQESEESEEGDWD